MFSCERGSYACAELLLEMGAKPEAKNDRKKTPLALVKNKTALAKLKTITPKPKPSSPVAGMLKKCVLGQLSFLNEMHERSPPLFLPPLPRPRKIVHLMIMLTEHSIHSRLNGVELFRRKRIRTYSGVVLIDNICCTPN